MSSPSVLSRVMIATAASWSITVARSRGLPSSLIAIAALARPAPIEPANSPPLIGPGNSRRAPSGKGIVTGPRDAGFVMISGFSLIVPVLRQRDDPVGRGETVTKKPRPAPGGVPGVRALRLISAHDLQASRPAGWW